MRSYTATQARQNIYKLVESVEVDHSPIQITSKTANAVLVSESDWQAMQETLHLLSVPGMRESIIEGMNTPPEDCDEDIQW